MSEGQQRFFVFTLVLALGFRRSEQRTEAKRKMYITAEILNEVINAFKREYPDVEVIREVVYFISFRQLMQWSLQKISMLVVVRMVYKFVRLNSRCWKLECLYSSLCFFSVSSTSTL